MPKLPQIAVIACGGLLKTKCVMKTKDQPINPCVMQQVGKNEYRLQKPNDDDQYNSPQMGLTKREHASILILAGLSANYLRENVTGWNPITYVKEAIELADLLFEELDSKTEI